MSDRAPHDFSLSPGAVRRVRRFLTDATHQRAFERFSDLRFDLIDARLREAGWWVVAAPEILRVAAAFRDDRRLPVHVGVGFTLVERDRPSGPDFDSPEEFRHQLEPTPPSLTLFGPDDRFWDEPDATRFSAQRLGVVNESGRLVACYVEWTIDSLGPHYRSAFLIAPRL
ncbi:MAG: hypothetical protein JSV80_01260 [Acidobacteriota bacterium]|nr:MAG: hypothetical protein JSV80_01260 [Acidobacteriota bacterium]